MAPEIIEGDAKQSIYSDMYSFGKVIFQIIKHGCINGLDCSKKEELATFAKKCVSPSHLSRPRAREGLSTLKALC